MTRKAFTREERLKAQKEAFEKSSKRGGSLYYLPDEQTLQDQYDVKYFKPKAGSIYLGILPRVEEAAFYKEVWVHYTVGPNKNSFLCPERMNNEKCPVCDYRRTLEKDGEDDEVLRDYRPSKRNLFWITNMKDKRTLAEGPMLYDAATGIILGIAGIVVNDRTGEILYDVVEDNINIVFKRIGEGFNTKYGGFKTEDRELKIPDDYYDLPSIDELLIKPDINEMSKAVGGAVEDTSEETEPVRGSSRRGRTEESESEEETIRERVPARRREPVEEKDDDLPFDDEKEEEPEKERVQSNIVRRRSR